MNRRTVAELRRALGALAPGAATEAAFGASLELRAPPVEPPRTRPCRPLEGGTAAPRSVAGPVPTEFAAFLDGTQESRAVAYPDGAPVVVGRVAAVIRARIARRMTTWGPGLRALRRLYVPERRLAPVVRRILVQSGLTIVNTIEDDEEPGADHPHELLRRAVHAVQADRERLERDLAEIWCQAEAATLFVDGGLPNGERASVASHCVGVVKTHHTLYVDGHSLPEVLAMPEGWRSRVFLIERAWGPPVASWYLRLRGPSAHDPLWGMVRVEVAQGSENGSLTARADLVSGWILAERSPLALPDSRWDVMVYGVRDCEEYLRASAER